MPHLSGRLNSVTVQTALASEQRYSREADCPDVRMPDRPQTLLDSLQRATQGLVWMSETEAPFEVVYWPEATLTPKTVRQLTGRAADVPVEEVDMDTFFEWAIAEQDWHTPAERAIVQRYQQLVQLLKQSLDPLAVYRIGKISLDIYILGQTAAGEVAGLATKAVET